MTPAILMLVFVVCFCRGTQLFFRHLWWKLFEITAIHADALKHNPDYYDQPWRYYDTGESS